jgi:hypothetical protein
LPLPVEPPTVIDTFTVWLPAEEASVITPLQVVPLAIPAGFTVTGIAVTVLLAV